MNAQTQGPSGPRTSLGFISASVPPREILDEPSFRRVLTIERKRAERSKESFILMLAEARHPAPPNQPTKQVHLNKLFARIYNILASCCRETDIIGWYKEGLAVGVLFTAVDVDDKSDVLGIIQNRISAALRDNLKIEKLNQISIYFHVYPDDWDLGEGDSRADTTLYPDLIGSQRRPISIALKRTLDIVGSLVLLVATSPLLAAIALAVKLTSKGPVLFRQQRIGQYGQCFTFLKFRSMFVNNDASEHKAFVTRMIADDGGHKLSAHDGEPIYKIKNDRRVTPVGRILRRTSLDELPQFFNVLCGDMSLVGPRPPIPYELAVYQTWHRRRVLEAKPGITGLWQVMGRSRVNFDEMVRLDLRYASSWTILMDLAILLRTPAAVLRGSGAF